MKDLLVATFEMMCRRFLLLIFIIWTPVNSFGQELEKKFREAGLVDVKEVNPKLKVDLRYSGTNNFMKVDLYQDLDKCFLQPDIAKRLSDAEEYLESRFPYYRLLLLDCARPKYIQRMMWDTVKDIFSEKIKFLSNPDMGSLHNYGAAVDVTLADEYGNGLDMGTAFDHKGELAYPEIEEILLKQGKLTYRQVENRKLLREVMKHAGFFNIQTEWWHFNACTRGVAAGKYKLLE